MFWFKNSVKNIFFPADPQYHIYGIFNKNSGLCALITFPAGRPPSINNLSPPPQLYVCILHK